MHELPPLLRLQRSERRPVCKARGTAVTGGTRPARDPRCPRPLLTHQAPHGGAERVFGRLPEGHGRRLPGAAPSRAAPSRRALLPFPGRGGAARRYGSGAAAITCGPGRAAPPRGAEPQRRSGPGSCVSGCGARPARRRRAPRPPRTRHRAARSTGSPARGEEPRLGAACWRPALGGVRRKKRHELPGSARPDRFCGRKKFGLNAVKLACKSPQKTEVEKELTLIPFAQSPHRAACASHSGAFFLWLLSVCRSIPSLTLSQTQTMPGNKTWHE